LFAAVLSIPPLVAALGTNVGSDVGSHAVGTAAATFSLGGEDDAGVGGFGEDQGRRRLPRSAVWVAAQNVRIAQDEVRKVGFEPRRSDIAGDGPAVWAEGIKKKMVIWHLPKTGGTTVCDLFKGTNVSSGSMNCWQNADGPEWCCLNRQFVAFKSCEDRNKQDPPLTMIERYMDSVPGKPQTLFCPGTIYGTVLREPISRVTSHLFNYAAMFARREVYDLMQGKDPEFFMQLVEGLDPFPISSKSNRQAANFIHRALNGTAVFRENDLEEKLRKMSAFSSNYMTRMLLGTQLGSDPLIGVPASAVTMELRGRALTALAGFDFILFTDQLSTQATLDRLGLSHLWTVAPPPPSHRIETDPLYTTLREGKFVAWFRLRNKLDVDVYSEVKRIRGPSLASSTKSL
jgi:hypothetical protein